MGPKRHFKRYEVDQVGGKLGPAYRLQVLNMSLTGLAVEAYFPLQIGETYRLTMDGRKESVEVPATTMWCHLTDTQRSDSSLGENMGGRHCGSLNVYQAGLDFKDALDDMADEILSFMQGNIILHPERHIPGRFRAHDDCVPLGGFKGGKDCAPLGGFKGGKDCVPLIELEVPHTFLLKTVSFSGMTVETEHSLLPLPDTVVDVALRDEELALDCPARIAHIGARRGSESVCDVGLEFVNLSIDDCLALDNFIRNGLE